MEETENVARWNRQIIPAGVWIYSCLFCGAAVVAGPDVRRHEMWHELNGDYAKLERLLAAVEAAPSS